MSQIIGVDLGGTSIVVGCVDRHGRDIRGKLVRPTPVEAGAEAVVDEIASMVSETIKTVRAEDPSVEFLGIGMGSPGPLDIETGVVILTPNLGWRNFALRQHVIDKTGLAATLDNDANCAVFGEWWVGAAKGYDSVIGFTLGTGVGGAWILNGKIYHGVSDVAGEFGHMTIDANGRRCKCGNYGCLEAYASGPAIALRARENIEAGSESSLASKISGDLSRITAEMVFRAAQAGDPVATDVVRETAVFLGAGVANLINALNPERVVICGGVTGAGDALFKPLRNQVMRRAFQSAVSACEIVPGSLGDSAGIIGAAASFLTQTGSEL